MVIIRVRLSWFVLCHQKPKIWKKRKFNSTQWFYEIEFQDQKEKKSGLSRARRLANRLSISAQVTRIIVYCLIKKKREISSDQLDSSLDQRTNRKKVA